VPTIEEQTLLTDTDIVVSYKIAGVLKFYSKVVHDLMSPTAEFTQTLAELCTLSWRVGVLKKHRQYPVGS